ncbi:MAG: hypothetical protein RMJ53_04980 [Chitinophagales bacterium]|nr:hypothetical protein [Chitinophagales bacterium]
MLARCIIFLILLLWSFATRASHNDTLLVYINLKNAHSAYPEVSIKLPDKISQPPKLRIVFPSYVPGSFTEVAPAYLINNLTLKNSSDHEITPKKIGLNMYESHNTPIKEMKFRFAFSWQNAVDAHGFFPQMGTAVKKESFILLNFGAFFPFIEGMEKLPLKLSIQKDAIYTGFSPLSKTYIGNNEETYVASNYLALIDNPVVFTTTYETTFKAGNTTFHCITNTYGKLSENILLQTLKPVCEGVIKFCRGLNVRDYYFFIFLIDSGDTRETFKEEHLGAIQHSSSSVMVFNNDNDFYKVAREIQFTAAHELFHLFEPLNIKTDVTSKFNLKARLPTAHLWLYEGVTEYFSLLMQLREDLITQSEFIQEIRTKISMMQFFEPFALVKKSEESILAGNETLYRNFYYKGCVAAMMLDLRLLELSEGQLNLQELLIRFRRSINDNYVVKDEELIGELVRISSFPELRDFFNQHIIGTVPFDFNKYLALIGWVYQQSREDTAKIYLSASFRYLRGSKNVFITNINIDQLGFKDGDILLKINNKRVYKDNVEDLMEKVSSLSSKDASFTVKRDGKIIKLTGKPLVVNKTQRNIIKVEKRPSPEKLFYRNTFRSGQLSAGRPYRLLN